MLPYEEFIALQQILMDVQDIVELREAKNIEKDEFGSKFLINRY